MSLPCSMPQKADELTALPSGFWVGEMVGMCRGWRVELGSSPGPGPAVAAGQLSLPVWKATPHLMAVPLGLRVHSLPVCLHTGLGFLRYSGLPCSSCPRPSNYFSVNSPQFPSLRVSSVSCQTLTRYGNHFLKFKLTQKVLA